MPTFTIFTVSADLLLLRTILNGVAMICNQVGFIWSFALLAATWRITSSNASIALASLQGQSGIAPKAAISAIIPLILAMLLTNPSMKVTVYVQSTITSNTVSVHNVPVIIAIIPSAASLLSKEVGAQVETAFQGVGTDYPSISASGNGFINPLKIMLTARTAIMQLEKIDSEVRTVVAACLTPGSSIDLDKTQQKVRNAGNTGAAVSAAATIQIDGEYGTGIGALLFEAAQNNVALVNELDPNTNVIMNCPDAVAYVANNIDNALLSPEYKRVVQGAVNGLDQPIAGANYDIAQFKTNYSAIRTASTPISALAGGTGQANVEALNLLFSELVGINLDCLKAEAASKTVCMAAATQSMEMETHNLQAAANEVPMLKYAGSFANYLIALIIGLGPVIVLFMMFAGVDAMKNVKTVAHIMIWPLLCMNVGAELINGMIYMTVCNFLTSLTQSGYLSHAVTYQAYKEFSLQIGTASHLMASLPILMSMIFALGASSSLVAVANSNNPNIKDTADQVQPRMQSAEPLVRNSSVAQAHQNASGNAVIAETGTLAAVSGSSGGAAANKQQRHAQVQAMTKGIQVQEGHDLVKSFEDADVASIMKSTGVTKAQAAKFVADYNRATGVTNNTATTDQAGSNDTTTRSATVAGAGELNVSTPGAPGQASPGQAATDLASGAPNATQPGKVSRGPSLPVGAKAGVTVGGSSAAAKTTITGLSTTETDGINKSKVIQTILGNALTQTKGGTTNKDRTSRLGRSITAVDSFKESITSGRTDTHSGEEADTLTTAGYSTGAMVVEDDQIARASSGNRAYAEFQRNTTNALRQFPEAEGYLQRAERSQGNFAMSTHPSTQLALNKSRAMRNMAEDQKASPEARVFAMNYLSEQAGVIHDNQPSTMSPDQWKELITGFKEIPQAEQIGKGPEATIQKVETALAKPPPTGGSLTREEARKLAQIKNVPTYEDLLRGSTVPEQAALIKGIAAQNGGVFTRAVYDAWLAAKETATGQ